MTRLIPPRWLLLTLVLSGSACSREVRTDPEDVSRLVASQGLTADSSATPNATFVTPRGDAMSPGPAGEPLAVPGAAAPPSSVLYSEADAEIGPRMDGVVREYLVDLGDAVEAGQLLAVLEDDREVVGLESAQAALELAELEFARATQLIEEGVVTQAEVDRANYQVRAARAAAQRAAVDLEMTRVRARFAGVVSRRFVRLGQAVEERTPLFRITALRPLRAVVRVPETEASRYAPGRSLRLHSPIGVSVNARIARVSPAVDPASGTVEVLVEVADPGRLRPGSAVTVELLP